MSLFYNNTGNFLLFHTSFPCSTIGATELNFRVRDGIGWNLCAIVTGKTWMDSYKRYRLFIRSKKIKRSQVSRLLSTTRLNALLHLHLWPIKPVFFWKSSVHKKGKSNLRRGFALICFQRLSLPNVATLRCHWYDNRYTRGLSISVLSY